MSEPILPPTLGDALLAQITRVRDQVLPTYLECGRGGTYAVAMMRRDLDQATRALAEQDAIECLRLFEELKGWRT